MDKGGCFVENSNPDLVPSLEFVQQVSGGTDIITLLIIDTGVYTIHVVYSCSHIDRPPLS